MIKNMKHVIQEQNLKRWKDTRKKPQILPVMKRPEN